MYDNSNVQWFSQTLLTYKDKVYATDGYLRLSISTNTEDFKFFNPPMLNISITNNYQKSINLNIQNARDLLRAFKLILEQLNGDELNIQRKYQKDTVLHFTFKVDPNNNIRIVIIEIRNNESDFTKVVVPLESVFESFASCIRGFTEQYMFVSSQLLVQSIQSQSTQTIQQIPSLIKGISSQIVSQITVPDEISDSRAPEVETEMVEKSQVTINDLDRFLGENLDNIVVPEIDNEEKGKVVHQVESLFVEYFMERDIRNLENAMTNYFMTDAPIIEMAADIKSKIGAHVKNENFTSLPGMSDDSLKSLVYISKLVSGLSYYNYLNNAIPIPATIPIMKYNADTHLDENLDIAYDLLLMNLYVRMARRRLENRIEDAIANKALFYMQLRCFTDPFVFSFLDKIDKTQLSSIISTRFTYYDSIGVFDSYKKNLDDLKCSAITLSDITSSVEEVVQKVIGLAPNIEVLHDKMVKKNGLRFTTEHKINLEQIVNEVLPLEIAEKTGKDITNEDIITNIKSKYNISDEILNMFIGKKQKTPAKSKIENKQTSSNLERLIRTQYLNEIPEQHRDSFMKYIIELDNKKFDLHNSEYPIDEFGDNVIKALYLWDPESDPTIVKNYKSFFLKVESELMDRDLILSKLKVVEEKVETSDDWDFLSES